MVRTHAEVPKRAINSIHIQLEKLVSKYGEKDVRLVVNKFFQQRTLQRKLEADIEAKESELKKLKSQKRKKGGGK